MTITFPNEACAVTCAWKTYLLLKRHFKNKIRMNGICYDITLILGSSDGYRENDLIMHDRFTVPESILL